MMEKRTLLIRDQLAVVHCFISSIALIILCNFATCFPLSICKDTTQHRNCRYFHWKNEVTIANGNFQQVHGLSLPGKINYARSLWKKEEPSEENNHEFQAKFLENFHNKRLRRYVIEGGQVNNSSVESTQLNLQRKGKHFEGSYWKRSNITYRILKYPRSAPEISVKRVIRNAFKVWEMSSYFKFTYKARGSVDIKIIFARRDHGDAQPFDGSVLAHAFFPRFGGEVHFDDDEFWSTEKSHEEFVDLYAVAVHEIGHSLGLMHSNNRDAIMAPFYKTRNAENLNLHRDDLDALQHLYGKMKPSEFIDYPFNSDNIANLCNNPIIDAMTVIGNGSAFVFQGEFYWKLNDDSLEPGYPRKISDDWYGMRGPIDAALTNMDGNSFFFKDDIYWLFDRDGKLNSGYPKLISAGLVGTPTNIDATFISPHDLKPYFFQGDKYWRYSHKGILYGYPKSVRYLFSASLQHRMKVDAAVNWLNGKSYIFIGRHFYKLNDWYPLRVADGYPRDTAMWWFGCSIGNHINK